MKVFSAIFLAVLLAAQSSAEDLGKLNYLGELDALDDYSLMEILDKLEYQDLFNLAMLSPHVQQLFADHYIAEYNWNKSEVILNLKSEDVLIHIKGNNWYNGRNYAESLFILRNFCHIFSRMKIRLYSIKFVEPVQILINKYCSKASQEIEIIGHNIDDIPDMYLLFEHVINVTISSRPYFESNPYRLDTAFPQMRKLMADCELDLSHHYPHLTEISIKKYKDTWDASEFVRLNPQLQTIQSPLYSNSRILTFLSELPRLENLFLSFNPWQYDPQNTTFATARFIRVKNFALRMYFREVNIIDSNAFTRILASIQFDRLESFSLVSNNPNTVDFLTDMIAKNTGLQKIIMDVDLTFDQLCVLIASLTELKELRITWRHHTTHELWNRFLLHVVTTNNSLDKFSIEIPWHFQIDTSDLLGVVPIGWNKIQTTGIRSSVLFSLERLT